MAVATNMFFGLVYRLDNLTQDVDSEWLDSPEAQEILSKITNREFSFTRYLEGFDSSTFTTKDIKVAVLGNPGSGKTCTIHNACGMDIPSTYNETLGLEVQTIFWPLRLLSGKRYLIRFEFWEVGGKRKFDHINQEAIDKADSLLYVLSIAEKADLSAIASQLSAYKSASLHTIMAATKTDVFYQAHVLPADLTEWNKTTEITVCTLSNLNSRVNDSDGSHPSRFRSQNRWPSKDIRILLDTIACEVLLPKLYGTTVERKVSGVA
eukprot:GILK01012850.1.p1 GENE.GILK01012850.1~~GILK01012850.1.p1  ORF type:complete len:277 (-),score=34.14 GILK01012850.1:96-890(-)